MLHWEVADEDGWHAPRPPGEPSATSRSRGQVGALLLIVVAALAAGLGWQLHQQEQAVRLRFAEVVREEARAIAFGQVEQAASLRDPAAPELWTFLYDEQFRWSRPVPVSPIVRGVTLQEEGKVALVEVAWPLPDAHGRAVPPVLEQRAYRLVGAQWRRTTLPQSEIRRTAHTRLQGQPADLDAFEEQVALDALREHLAQHWAAAVGLSYERAATPTVIVESQPYGRTVLLNSEQFVVNSPRFASTLSPPEWERRPQETSSLPAEARYRMNVVEAYLYRSLRSDWARRLSGQSRTDLLELYRQLIQAEVRQWALTEAEREALRGAWRAELAGESPALSGPLLLSISDAQAMNPAEREAAWEVQRQRRLVLALWLDERVAAEGPERLGQIATHLVQRVEQAHEPVSLEWSALLSDSAAPQPLRSRP